MPSTQLRRFGTFEVDLHARELRRGGLRVKLQDQPFQLLAMMLERPGQLVTREELRRRLWADGMFVDFERNLNAAVKRLRSALGDSADNPRFVETLHRRGYRFIAPITGDASERVAEPHGSFPVTASGTPRLAVLPFTNIGGAPDDDYFCDGLTEELIIKIGRACTGKVGIIARTSAMRFKGGTRRVRDIGHDLGVDYVLEGSIRRDADRLRITAQLVEANDETRLWSDTYDRRLEDCFAVQADVAERVAQSLALQLIPGVRATLMRCCPQRIGAYQAFLKGRFHWNKTGDEGLEQAVGYYKQALSLDPDFAAAHAALARASIALADHWLRPGREVLPEAETAALRALELDPSLPDGHLALAEVKKALDWDWAAAEARYQRAIALSRNCEGGHRTYALFLSGMLRLEEAATEAERACDIDPLCLTVNTNAAWVHYVAGSYDAAIQHCAHAIELDATFVAPRRMRGAVLLQTGDRALALAELEEAVRIGGTDPVSWAWLAHALAVDGRRPDAQALVSRLQDLARERYVPAYHLALAHAGLDDLDSAFESLDRACDERDPSLLCARVDPRFDALRHDARYGSLLDRLGIDRGPVDRIGNRAQAGLEPIS